MDNRLENAYWIKVDSKDNINEINSIKTLCFKNTFELKGIGNLELLISANSRYRLWINGRPVTSGPCKGDRWRRYYETVDVCFR